MASAIASLPPPAGFRRLYKLSDAKYTLTNLENSRAKVATFVDLNDPFELAGAELRDGAIRKAVKAHKAHVNATTGILSLTSDWRNPVLWSHYADQHAGICLGFDVRLTAVEAVRYEDKRLLAALDKSAGNPWHLSDALQRRLRCTKAHYWAYEEEYRQFISLPAAISDDGLYFVPFGPDLILKEVILGVRCTEDLLAVRKRVRVRHGDGVVTFPARLAWTSFHMVPQESNVP